MIAAAGAEDAAAALGRAGVGLLLAGAVSGAAWRLRLLSTSGAVAATSLGALCVWAGWSWATLLVAFFLSSSLLSRVGAARKAERTAGIVAKAGARDAAQVLVNGGPFAAAAAAWLATGAESWVAFGGGALAAAAADTWGTEVGTLAGARPRLVTTWRPVAPGTSGGVTTPGLAATVAGATFIGALAVLLGWPVAVGAAAAGGGVAGALADSLAGALVQARHHCPRCDQTTEQLVHLCGTPTRLAGGIAWLDNDVVNLVAGAVGGLVGVLLAG